MDEHRTPAPIDDQSTAKDVQLLLAAMLKRGRSPWVTVHEAELYARVKTGTIREAIAKKKIATYQRTPKSLVLINLNDVDRWISSWQSAQGEKHTEKAAGAPPPAAPAEHGDSGLLSLDVYEWMWRKDGLGLRPGAELVVYALVYRTSRPGGEAMVATNASIADILGYPRETVSRTLQKLLKSDLIQVVGHIDSGRSRKAIKRYAVCEEAIERALRRIRVNRRQT